MKKSNKTKCIEMWEWLADNPGKNKDDWAEAHPRLAREIICSNLCFACKEVNCNCDICPVCWSEDDDHCTDAGPYADWEYNHTRENALNIIYCIEDTWKDTSW